MDIRLQKAPCGFLSTNDAGTIKEVNETFLRWTGYKAEALVGQHIEMLFTATNKLMFHSYFYPAIQLKNIVEEFFISMKDADRQNIPLLMNAKRYVRDGEEVIDHFKNVNDTYGHQIGDVVLEQLAQLLKEAVGEQGIVCRFGGEEFTIILIGHDQEVANTISERVAEKSWPHVAHLTVSIGMAYFKADDTEETLIECADQALYYSKEHGRNRVTVYENMSK